MMDLTASSTTPLLLSKSFNTSHQQLWRRLQSVWPPFAPLMMHYNCCFPRTKRRRVYNPSKFTFKSDCDLPRKQETLATPNAKTSLEPCAIS